MTIIYKKGGEAMLRIYMKWLIIGTTVVILAMAIIFALVQAG